MSKKNTLLYLDEDLVKKAKKEDINLSKLTESAIRSRLFSDVSVGESIVANLKEYLENLEEQGRCFRLPQKIEEVKLENVGPFDEFHETFEPFTAVTGPNGSGKTVLLESIAHACGHSNEGLEKLKKQGKERGRIDVKTSGNGKNSIVLEDNEARRENVGCILIDDPMVRLGEEKREEFIEILQNRFVDEGCQVILTGRTFDEDGFMGKVIELCD